MCQTGRTDDDTSGYPLVEHYAYCRDVDCQGCLPSDGWINNADILDLWAEMWRCCIAQTPETKTPTGARDAIFKDRPSYIRVARFCRDEHLAGRQATAEQIRAIMDGPS